MPAPEPNALLLSQLTPLLKRHRFRREPDEAGFAIFGRKLDGCLERIGIRTATGGSKQGDVAVSIAMGIEFSDLKPERIWIGMPRTHGSVELKLLNKAAKKEYVCSAGTDLKLLAARLVEQIVEASEELQRRSEKLRKAYVSLVEARGTNIRKRLAIFAERKAKDLKSKKPKGSKSAVSSPMDSINTFEIAVSLLRVKTDQVRTVEMQEFDDHEAHDRHWTERVVQRLIEQAIVLQTELARVLDAPHETGTTEHKLLPVNGVCYFASWSIGWKHLYLCVSHEDIGLPCCLDMGTLSRNQNGTV
jgi:hypothetical protein